MKNIQIKSLFTVFVFAMMNVSFSQMITPEVIYTNSNLCGISNAVLFNGQVHYVLASHPTANLPGYPDANAKFVRLTLMNEAGQVHQYEINSVADFPVSSDLQIAPDGNLAFVYQAPSGSSYGFKMPYKIWNGTSLIQNELIFDNVNWGTWPRLQYDNNGTPHVASFAHAGYFLKHHTKVSSWETTDVTDFDTYIGDLSATISNGVFYVLGRLGIGVDNSRTLRLYYKQANTWNYEDIVLNMDRSCDLKFSNTGSMHALYTQNGQLKLAVKTGNNWATETVATQDTIYHRASLFFKPDNSLIIAYQTNKKFAVLEKNGANWSELFVHDNLIWSQYLASSRHPSLIRKNEKVYALYSDGQNVYLTNLNPSGSNIYSDNRELGFSVFPIPFKDDLNIQIRDNAECEVNIYNVSGSLMYSDVLYGNNRIRTIDFSKGIYFIEIKNMQGSSFKKIIKT